MKNISTAMIATQHSINYRALCDRVRIKYDIVMYHFRKGIPLEDGYSEDLYSGMTDKERAILGRHL